MATVPPGFPPPPPPVPPWPAGGSRTGPPWETSAPFVQRLIDTAKGVALEPSAFFAAMRLDGGLVNPLLYAVVGTIGAGFISALEGAVLPFIQADFFTHLVIIPCIIAVALFIGSGIHHLILTLLGGAKQPYEATFRVGAYSLGTAIWGTVVPICGGPVASIFSLVCLVIGLQKAHDVSTGTAVAVVLIPMAVCGLAALTIAMLGVGAALLGGALAGLFG